MFLAAKTNREDSLAEVQSCARVFFKESMILAPNDLVKYGMSRNERKILCFYDEVTHIFIY